MVTVVAIIYVYEGQRRIPVQISKQIRGNRVVRRRLDAHSAQGQLGGHDSADLRLEHADFAVDDLQLLRQQRHHDLRHRDRRRHRDEDLRDVQRGRRSWVYWTLYFIMVVAFTFFYALVIFQQQNIAENLQRQNGFIPGIRPGRPTHQYLSAVLIRITVAGALFLGIVAVLPFFVKTATGFQTLTISSTAMLIVVGVALDTMRQLEAQLIMRNYRGFIGR